VAALSAIGIGLTESYPLLLMLFAVNGIGFTFFSGAEETWAIDNLRHHNREDLVEDFYAKNQAIRYLGMFLGPLAAGATVGAWGIQPLWFVWGCGYFTAAAALTALPEHYTPRPQPHPTPYVRRSNKPARPCGSCARTATSGWRSLLPRSSLCCSWTADFGNPS